MRLPDFPAFCKLFPKRAGRNPNLYILSTKQFRNRNFKYTKRRPLPANAGCGAAGTCGFDSSSAGMLDAGSSMNDEQRTRNEQDSGPAVQILTSGFCLPASVPCLPGSGCRMLDGGQRAGINGQRKAKIQNTKDEIRNKCENQRYKKRRKRSASHT
jgi:hypothetical protein